ncbi:MAG: YfiR family protein [Breznakibacter sp.]
MNLKRNLIFFTAVLCLSTGVKAQQLHKAQANYIYNFTRFIEWPNMAQRTEFVIGILGKNHPVTAELNATASQRSVGSATVKIVEFQSADQVDNCQVLFVPDSKSANLKNIHAKFGSQPVLVLTEEQDWNPAESSINFLVVDSKLAFHVNPQNLKAKQLKVSDKLIAMSK